MTFDASSYTLTAPDTAVTNAEVGTHTVTLEFTDNAPTPNTVTETITISVSDVNDAPSVKSTKPADYDVATQHSPYSLDLNTLFEDIDVGAAYDVEPEKVKQVLNAMLASLCHDQSGGSARSDDRGQ